MRVGTNHLPPANKAQVFEFNSGDHLWTKPRGYTMLQMLAIGGGGAGGSGAVGANSTAAGGGGGGSGAQSMLTIPLYLLPDTLLISVAPPAVAANGQPSLVGLPIANANTAANHLILRAAGGGQGGNAAGATAGAAGAAGAVATMASACLAGLGTPIFLAGQAGIIGGTTVSGASLTIPTTGLVCTGGTGGGGLPAAAAAGTSGGSFTVPTAPTTFPAQSGGVGSATATNPADPGRSGLILRQLGAMNFFNYGGTGGASTHGTATGGGLVQGNGGNGVGYGCGGGGMGGALTGSSAGVRSIGGPGYLLLVCW